MQKNKNRQGLALGVIAALIGTLVSGLPATAADQSNVVIYPNAGEVTQTTMLNTEAFDIQFDFGTSVADRYIDLTNAAASGFGLQISKPAGVTLSAALKSGVTANEVEDTQISSSTAVNVGTTAATSVSLGFASSASQQVIALALPSRTSVSAAVTLTLTPFMDLDNDGEKDNGEALGTPMTVTFVPWSELGTVLNLQQPVAGVIGATASVTVTAGTINWAQLDSSFNIGFGSTNDGRALAYHATTSSSGDVTAASLESSLNFSKSASVTTAAFSGSPVASVSAQVFYGGAALTAAVTKGVSANLATGGLTISAVVGDNLIVTDNNDGEARINSAITLKAYGYSNSNTTSVAIDRAVTVSGISSLVFGPSAGVILNGTTYTSSAALLAAGFTLPSGTNTFALSTYGQTTDGAYIEFSMTYQIVTAATYKVTLRTPDYVVDFDGANASSAVGTAKSFAVAVEDQWGVAPTRTDLRVAASAVVSGSQSETVSSAVSAGAASVAVTPLPATRTASDAVVTFTLQMFNQATGIWDAVDTDTVTLNIYATADAFVTGGGAASSVSVSISHTARDGGWSFSSTALTYTVLNSYSNVVVSAPGLVILNTATEDTASGTLTFQANVKAVSLKFAGTVAGTYTVTLTNGSGSTTSKVVIDAADGEDGTKVSIAVSASAVPQKTIDVVVTVTDLFGNPVDTATASQLTLTATGAGFFSNGAREQTATTDANGKATFTLTSGANDSGNLYLVATYEGTDEASASAVVAIAPAPVATAQTVSVVASAATVEAGKNADVTITVTDSDGKAHAYKTVVVYSTGAGYLSAQTVTTDGNGKAVVKLITGANESGTATITASVGGKSGTATVTVLAPVVVAPPVVVVPEVTAVIGSFNGRWAVRVENAKGATVNIKVGGNWFKVTATSNNFVFSRKSVVGATPLVKVWVDGELQNEQTITVK